jgi:hypothetical protein
MYEFLRYFKDSDWCRVPIASDKENISIYRLKAPVHVAVGSIAWRLWLNVCFKIDKF